MSLSCALPDRCSAPTPHSWLRVGRGGGCHFSATERAHKRNAGQIDAEWRLPGERHLRATRPPPPLLAGRVLFIGLDVHNDSIAVSLAPSDSTEVRRYGIIGGSGADASVQHV